MLTLDLRVSRLALLCSLTLNLVGFSAVILADLNIWLTLAMSFGLLGLGLPHLGAQLSGAAERICRCRVSPQSWILETRAQQHRYQPPEVVFMSELLIVLQFNWELDAADPERSRSRVLLVFPDSLIQSQAKSLRRYLRFETLS